VYMQAHVHGDERRSENSESHGYEHDGRRLSKRPADERGVFNHRAL